MAITTYAMLQTTDAYTAGILVFCAGLAMAPVVSTTLAMVAMLFPNDRYRHGNCDHVRLELVWLSAQKSSGPSRGPIPTGLRQDSWCCPRFSVLMIVVESGATDPCLKSRQKVAAGR